MTKSLFLEGSDGSGKSTQLTLLKRYLKEKGIEILELREPGGSDYFEALREFYLHAPHDHPPISDALLSAAGRAANIDQAKQAMAKNKWVLSDRTYPSSYVYQAVQGVPLEDIKTINRLALQDFDFDIKFLLDVPADIAAQRINSTGAKKDYWESLGLDFFKTVREKYLEIAKAENYIVIDASNDIQVVHQKIISHLGI